MAETAAAAPLKLNLGSRNRAMGAHGFQNMDIDAHEGVDHVGDVSDLSRFASGSVHSVYASHILEHFPHVRTAAVLAEWARVLRPGGALYVAVPDFRRTVELYLATGGLSDWVQNYLWGDQGYATAFHYAGFDEERLARLLKAAGFKESSRVTEFHFKAEDCSRLRSTWDKKPISLNMVAIKGAR